MLQALKRSLVCRVKGINVEINRETIEFGRGVDSAHGVYHHFFVSRKR